MKKIINAPENYVDEMLKGIYAAHPDKVKYVEDDLRYYCIANKKPGKALKGVTAFGGAELAKYLVGFAAGVQKRGKCEVGQRTIYDAILPAANAAAAKAEADPEASLSDVIGAALEAAKAGVEATRDMVPVFGKAAVHAAQCVGVEDQGAVAGYYKILGLSNYINA